MTEKILKKLEKYCEIYGIDEKEILKVISEIGISLNDLHFMGAEVKIFKGDIFCETQIIFKFILINSSVNGFREIHVVFPEYFGKAWKYSRKTPYYVVY